MFHFLRRLLRIILIIITSLFGIPSVHASPKEIIVIRHADKLLQVKSGPFLSPKGQVRAIAFAIYYLNKFPEPNYIIASNPSSLKNKSSLRELQTVAPLANELAERHPLSDYTVIRDYQNGEEKRLAEDLLHDKKFNDTVILICWHHNKIPDLLMNLGIDMRNISLDINNFDTVFVIEYDANENVIQFNILNKQYNVLFNGSWAQFYYKMMS